MCPYCVRAGVIYDLKCLCCVGRLRAEDVKREQVDDVIRRVRASLRIVEDDHDISRIAE